MVPVIHTHFRWLLLTIIESIIILATVSKNDYQFYTNDNRLLHFLKLCGQFSPYWSPEKEIPHRFL